MGKRYWFRAKTFGIGWGLPASWQGWVVLGLFVAGLSASAHWLLPARFGLFLLVDGGLVLALIAICFLKGEPLRA